MIRCAGGNLRLQDQQQEHGGHGGTEDTEDTEGNREQRVTCAVSLVPIVPLLIHRDRRGPVVPVVCPLLQSPLPASWPSSSATPREIAILSETKDLLRSVSNPASHKSGRDGSFARCARSG